MGALDNVVIGVSMRPEHMQILEKVGEIPLLKSAKNITFLHVFNKKTLPFLPAHLNFPQDVEEIEKYCHAQMHALVSQSRVGQSAARVRTECLFSKGALLSILNYLRANNADLFVAAAAGVYGIEGMFHHSLAARLVEEAPCNVYILRPQNEEILDNVEVLRKNVVGVLPEYDVYYRARDSC